MMQMLVIVFIAVATWVCQQVDLQAGTVSTSFRVAATVEGGCTVGTTGLSFGSYIQTGVSTTGSITVTCPQNMQYVLTLGGGLNYEMTAGYRRMLGNAGELLNYNLYMDQNQDSMWGDGGFQNTARHGFGFVSSATGVAQTFTVYGRVFGNQTVPNGTYADDVVATINF